MAADVHDHHRHEVQGTQVCRVAIRSGELLLQSGYGTLSTQRVQNMLLRQIVAAEHLQTIDASDTSQNHTREHECTNAQNTQNTADLLSVACKFKEHVLPSVLVTARLCAQQKSSQE